MWERKCSNKASDMLKKTPPLSLHSGARIATGKVTGIPSGQVARDTDLGNPAFLRLEAHEIYKTSYMASLQRVSLAMSLTASLTVTGFAVGNAARDLTVSPSLSPFSSTLSLSRTCIWPCRGKYM